MMSIFSLLGILVTVFLETFLIPFPLTLLLLLFLAIFARSERVFFFALLGGFLLDSLFFRPLGTTEIFFIAMLGLLFAYSRKFEAQSLLFLLFSAAASVGLYSIIFGQGFFLLQSAIAFVVTLLVFLLTSLIFRMEKHP